MAGVALASGSAFADTVPTIAYDSVPDPVRMPPNTFLGECSGIAVNSKGHVFVLSRGDTSGPAYGAAAAQLLEFDPDGRFVREIGSASTPDPSPTRSRWTPPTTCASSSAGSSMGQAGASGINR